VCGWGGFFFFCLGVFFLHLLFLVCLVFIGRFSFGVFFLFVFCFFFVLFFLFFCVWDQLIATQSILVLSLRTLFAPPFASPTFNAFLFDWFLFRAPCPEGSHSVVEPTPDQHGNSICTPRVFPAERDSGHRLSLVGLFFFLGFVSGSPSRSPPVPFSAVV